MKILHITPTYFPAVRYGGPIFAVHGLCSGLVRLGHEVHVYTTNVDGPENSAVPLDRDVEKDGVRIRYFPCGPVRKVYYAPALKEAVMRNIHDFDMVHLQAIFIWTTWMAGRIAKNNHKPYVLSLHGTLDPDLIIRRHQCHKQVWLKLFDEYTLKHASGIHATSNLEAQKLNTCVVCRGKIFVVPNGYSGNSAEENVLQSGKVPAELSRYDQFVLFLGRIHPIKGLDRLIQALSLVPRAVLVIAGNDENGYQAVLEKLIVAVRVQDRVFFTGPVYGRQKEELLRRAVLFVMPSYSESFGSSVLEAMAQGCPVVVTPQVGLAETVKREGCGVVTDGDPENLGRCLRELLQNPEALAAMGEKGKIVAEQQFDWKIIAQSMVCHYERLLNR
ncbi:MAG: hypothetical protein A2Z83_05695 [Omnitrophica bacterium GWA2_52_8]|nr:MAG: hypothetical protein A2Z83_05695 [Omnitrophica bacterium GWA2_52_8]